MDNWFKSSDDQNQPRVEDRPGLRFSRSRPYTRKKSVSQPKQVHVRLAPLLFRRFATMHIKLH